MKRMANNSIGRSAALRAGDQRHALTVLVSVPFEVIAAVPIVSAAGRNE
jgi:hypothetical protein